MAVDDIAALCMVFISGEVTADHNLVICHRKKHGIGTARLPLAVFAMADTAHLQVAFDRIVHSPAKATPYHRHLRSP
jgi:hypothetical protein